MMEFKKYRKTAVAEMVQVTKENIEQIQKEVLETSINPIFEITETGYKIGNLESNGYFADYGSYLCREQVENGCNYYPIKESIHQSNYELCE